MALHLPTDDHAHPPVPRGALVGAGALIVVALLLATVSRLTNVGATRVPDAVAVASVALAFSDRADGAVVVSRAADGRVVEVLAPGTNGFARGALRGLARERRRSHVDAAPPFQLTRWSDGRLSLADPSTGRRIELDVFGPTNAAVFARLLTAASAP